MNKPKAIFFDLDETLVENVVPVQQLFAEMYYQFSDQLGHNNRDAFFTALRNNAADLWATMFDNNEPPEQQFIQCFTTTIASLKTVPTNEAGQLAEQMFNKFTAMSASNVRLNNGATETLGTLRETGFITGIITNGMEQVQMGKIQALALHTQVDQVIISAQARAHKPHPAVFELALQKAQVKPHQAWHIGDHITNDVGGAIGAGLKGIFYNPLQKDVEMLFGDALEMPSTSIHHLTDVVNLATKSTAETIQ